MTDGVADPDLDLERAGTSDHLDETPDQSRTFRAIDWLRRRAATVLLVTASLVLLLTAILGVSIPRSVRIVGLSAALAGLLIGRPTARKVQSMLWSPSYIYLVDLDARVRKGAIYRVPSEEFREWTVTEGQLDWISPNLTVGKDVDLAERTVTGTWRGTLTDRELLSALDAVRECRGLLEDDARKGRRLDANGFQIVRRATFAAVQQVIRTFERGTLPDSGEGLTAAIDDTLEEMGMERNLDGLDLDPDDADLVTELDLDLDDVTGGGLPRQNGAEDGGATADD